MVWLHRQPVALAFDAGEMADLMTAKDVVEVWYPDKAATISIPPQSQKYYKQLEYDGTTVLGYSCDHQQRACASSLCGLRISDTIYFGFGFLGSSSAVFFLRSRLNALGPTMSVAKPTMPNMRMQI